MASLLDSDTSELVFQLEGNTHVFSSIRLRNTSENHVAFKIQCTRRSRYGVQPWIGILSPQESCEVSVKTQAPRRAPTNVQTWQSKDIFRIRSVLASPGTTKEDAPNLFNMAVAHMIEESILRVVYTLPQAQNLTPPSLAATPEIADPVVEDQHNDLQVVSGTIVEPSASQLVAVSARDGNIHIGALILMCFIFTLTVVVSYYLMKQTCSLIWTLMKSMAMLMMKMVTKLVSECIEDWVAKTLICVIMSLGYKYKEWLCLIKRARVWDRVIDVTNWKIKFTRMLTN